MIDGFCLTCLAPLQVVHGALHTPASAVQNMGVDHGRFDVFMPEQFLNRSYIVAHFQQMCRKRMAKRVAGGSFGQPVRSIFGPLWIPVNFKNWHPQITINVGDS